MTKDSRKQVLVIMPQPLDQKVGGIGRLINYSIREFAHLGPSYEFRYLETRLTEIPIIVHLSTLLAFMGFIATLIVRRIDLLHIHVAPRGSTLRKAIFARVGKLFGKPIVLHLHGSGYDDFFSRQSNFVKARIRKFFQSADAVIVLGQGWRDWAISNDGLRLDLAHVQIIDNGVPEPGNVATRNNVIPRIIFVGVVGRRKGVDVLLNALAAIPSDLQWVCTICGNGEVEAYTAAAQRLGLLRDRVTFTGWQSEAEVRAQMAASDIYVLPSRAENQPIAILEAMAIGLPVVASNVGDIPNQVRDGITGRIVPTEDSDALRSALEELLRNKSMREMMGEAGRAKFVQNYSISNNVSRTLALYRSLIS